MSNEVDAVFFKSTRLEIAIMGRTDAHKSSSHQTRCSTRPLRVSSQGQIRTQCMSCTPILCTDNVAGPPDPPWSRFRSIRRPFTTFRLTPPEAVLPEAFHFRIFPRVLQQRRIRASPRRPSSGLARSFTHSASAAASDGSGQGSAYILPFLTGWYDPCVPYHASVIEGEVVMPARLPA